jgi:hypothetical protein
MVAQLCPRGFALPFVAPYRVSYPAFSGLHSIYIHNLWEDAIENTICLV